MYGRKFDWRNLAIIVVAILIVVLIVSLFAGNRKDDNDYKKVNINWTVGGVSETGSFDDDIDNAMLSQRIKIGNGFKVEPKFVKGVTYLVHYYNDNDEYIGSEPAESSSILETTATTIVENLELEEGVVVTYFRVEMFPNDKDGDINFFERIKHSGDITISTIEAE